MLDDAFKLTLDYLYPPIKDLKVFKKAEEGKKTITTRKNNKRTKTKNK